MQPTEFQVFGKSLVRWEAMLTQQESQEAAEVGRQEDPTQMSSAKVHTTSEAWQESHWSSEKLGALSDKASHITKMRLPWSDRVGLRIQNVTLSLKKKKKHNPSTLYPPQGSGNLQY